MRGDSRVEQEWDERAVEEEDGAEREDSDEGLTNSKSRSLPLIEDVGPTPRTTSAKQTVRKAGRFGS